MMEGPGAGPGRERAPAESIPPGLARFYRGGRDAPARSLASPASDRGCEGKEDYFVRTSEKVVVDGGVAPPDFTENVAVPFAGTLNRA